MPTPLMSAYSASKHAVKGYVESLRIELGGDDVPISDLAGEAVGDRHAILASTRPIMLGDRRSETGEAQVPPLIYAPELVADAILDCCVTGRREMTVGGSGKAQTLFAQHFKGLYDKARPRRDRRR